ncbi:MAG TPA: MotA/TolQ/ExbB proton channel family protein [Pirellulaceae bacterium]|nr:MotA/TolQ/ExbB proton channel family protein [Pirellulaceae bacterium]HMO92367.1 MotA/TolQ/ExbB proton channel family protein [Pirellulaceae bacterium]HMP70770.1 MotA/TolQ/ExbB proton channel family protein [Pirellulaceae bacterium]
MSNTPSLSWNRQDIEQRFFFPGGRHTRVNSFFSSLVGMVFAIGFYLVLLPFSESTISTNFTRQGPIPYAIVFFTGWSLAILLIKWRKLAFQQKSLTYRVVPNDPDFILSGGNADFVFDNIYQIVDDPKHFILFNRINVALSNLKNLGRVGDVGEILQAQAEQDETALDTSYSLLVGFIWAIPVLGFIGTVLGLSVAIGGFAEVLAQSDTNDLEPIKFELRKMTAGLGMAFVTTLQALVAALFLQLMITFLKKSEEEFLEKCSEYCSRNIVNRLRILPFSATKPDGE